MLIDGNSLTYRAFFALPTDLATASGQVTNAVYGFASMLINLVKDQQPDRIVVAFDRPEPTFRHKALPSYKANRESSPDILRQQMGLVRQLVELLGIPIVEIVGFEADDVLATLATRSAEAGEDALIVTGDRDSYQLVRDPHIKVMYNKRGVSDYALYDEAGIFERTGVTPAQYPAYAALRGDPSDNLPGVPGVGEKTAAKLISTYGGIDGIYANLDALTPKLRQNLADHEEIARNNENLMALVHDVPLEVTDDQLQRRPIDVDAVVEFFQFLEMNSLVSRLAESFGLNVAAEESQTRVLTPEVTEISDIDEAKRALIAIGKASADSEQPIAIAGQWSGDPGRSGFEGLAVVTDASLGEVTWFPWATMCALDESFTEFFDGRLSFVGHDVKPLMRFLLSCDLDLRGLVLDTKISAYLLDPSDNRYALDELLGRYAQAELGGADATPSGQLDFGSASAPLWSTAAAAALGVAVLYPHLIDALESRGLTKLNEDIEIPLVRVLARMEDVGIGVDESVLRGLNDRFVAEGATLRESIIGLAGEDFNVNSTPQLRAVLFDKLGLTPQKKTKTGYSTDAATLEKLRDDHPIVEQLLRYREVEKLRSTYGEGLLAEIAPDGRIHATFNQTVARTGRLSSDAPNLHNIPVRSVDGRLFRDAFVPPATWKFIVADYNQIELRCIAHLSADPGLLEAFNSDTDIHNQTAARIFGVESADVTTDQRSKAKMVSYGLAYGMEAFGLGQRLGIPTSEAQSILNAYFVAFPAVHDYMERTVDEARERGYTETLFGRRRQIPELSSSIRSVRQAGERQAMNAGIQGLAADIFKLALVRLDHMLESRQLESRLVLQVHDEVIVEGPEPELESVRDIVIEAMTNAFSMAVPLVVHLETGSSWGAAKG